MLEKVNIHMVNNKSRPIYFIVPEIISLLLSGPWVQLESSWLLSRYKCHSYTFWDILPCWPILWFRDQTTVFSANSGNVVLGCIIKQVEQAIASKIVSRFLHRPASFSLLLLPVQNSLKWWTTIWTCSSNRFYPSLVVLVKFRQ